MIRDYFRLPEKRVYQIKDDWCIKHEFIELPEPWEYVVENVFTNDLRCMIESGKMSCEDLQEYLIIYYDKNISIKNIMCLTYLI